MNWLYSGKTHGGTYPCVACLRHRTASFRDVNKLRTFVENTANAVRYRATVEGISDSFHKKAYSEFNNCIRAALVGDEADGVILEKLTPNSLHMKLRVINKLMNDMSKAYPDVAEEFVKGLGLTKERYHDEFEGRA